MRFSVNLFRKFNGPLSVISIDARHMRKKAESSKMRLESRRRWDDNHSAFNILHFADLSHRGEALQPTNPIKFTMRTLRRSSASCLVSILIHLFSLSMPSTYTTFDVYLMHSPVIMLHFTERGPSLFLCNRFFGRLCWCKPKRALLNLVTHRLEGPMRHNCAASIMSRSPLQQMHNAVPIKHRSPFYDNYCCAARLAQKRNAIEY